jgi:hypothetical protein
MAIYTTKIGSTICICLFSSKHLLAILDYIHMSLAMLLQLRIESALWVISGKNCKYMAKKHVVRDVFRLKICLYSIFLIKEGFSESSYNLLLIFVISL